MLSSVGTVGCLDAGEDPLSVPHIGDDPAIRQCPAIRQHPAIHQCPVIGDDAAIGRTMLSVMTLLSTAPCDRRHLAIRYNLLSVVPCDPLRPVIGGTLRSATPDSRRHPAIGRSLLSAGSCDSPHPVIGSTLRSATPCYLSPYILRPVKYIFEVGRPLLLLKWFHNQWINRTNVRHRL
jgi:hypothetical protein